MNRDLTRRWIEHWEQKRTRAYDDATGLYIHPGAKLVGKATVGIGCNLDAPGMDKLFARQGWDYRGVRSGSVGLSDEQVEWLFDQAIDVALLNARHLVSGFDFLTDDQQLVMLDLAFNLGEHGLSEFQHFLAAVRAGNWTAAVAELQHSKWFNQVGERAKADCAVLGNASGSCLDAASILQRKESL